MPHLAGDLEIFTGGVAGGREQDVASREFETARARRNRRLHFGSAKRIVAVVAGVSPAFSRVFAAEDGCLHRRQKWRFQLKRTLSFSP